MPKNQEQLLADFLARSDKKVMTEEDFLAAFEKVISFVKGAKEATQKELDQLRQTYHLLLTSQGKRHDDASAKLHALFEKAGVGPQMEKMMKAHEDMLSKHTEAIKGIRNGKDGARGPQGFPGIDGRKMTPEEIVVKVNQSQILIKPEQIEGLALLQKKVDLATKAGGGRRIISGPMNLTQYHNASSQADGSNRTFTGIPSARYVPMVFLKGQNPVTLLAGVDYTIGRNSITLDNSIEPPAIGVGVYIQFIK